MARARSLKPSLFKNEILGVADPLFTLAFEGLWTLADREGRLEDRPLRMKAEIFPYRDNIDFDGMMNWLQENDFILRYSVNGKKYIQILNFIKHQNPHKNEVASEIPGSDQVTLPIYSESVPIKSEVLPINTEALGLTPLTLNPEPLTLNPLKNMTPSAASPQVEIIEPTAQDFIFTVGKQLLGEKAGSIIGKARKGIGDEKVTEVLAHMAAMKPQVSDPVPYFIRATSPKPRHVAA